LWQFAQGKNCEANKDSRYWVTDSQTNMFAPQQLEKQQRNGVFHEVHAEML
jgi:hypothetical protein